MEDVALERKGILGIGEHAELERPVCSDAIVETLAQICIRPSDTVDVKFAVLALVADDENTAGRFRHEPVDGFMIELVGTD